MSTTPTGVNKASVSDRMGSDRIVSLLGARCFVCCTAQRNALQCTGSQCQKVFNVLYYLDYQLECLAKHAVDSVQLINLVLGTNISNASILLWN